MAETKTVTAKVKADTRGATQGFESLAAGVAAAGAAVVAAGAALTKFTLDQAALGDQLAKNAKQIGESTDTLQRLTFAMERSGGSGESLQKALRNLSVGLDDISLGKAGPVAEGLNAIGLAAGSLSGLSGEDKLGRIAERLKRIQNPSERSAIAMKLFGKRAGAELKPLLDEGAKGIRALGDELESMGGVIEGDVLSANEALIDAQTDLDHAYRGVAARIANEFSPSVKEGMELLTAMAPAVEATAKDAAGGLNRMLESATALGELADALGLTSESAEDADESFADLFRTYAALITFGASELGIAAWEALPDAIDAVTRAVRTLTGEMNVHMEAISTTPSMLDSVGDAFVNLGNDIQEALQPGLDTIEQFTNAMEMAQQSGFLAAQAGAKPPKSRGRVRRRREEEIAPATSPDFNQDFSTIIAMNREGFDDGRHHEELVEKAQERIQLLDMEIERTQALGQDAEFMIQRRAELEIEFAELQNDQALEAQIRHDEEIRRIHQRADAEEAAQARILNAFSHAQQVEAQGLNTFTKIHSIALDRRTKAEVIRMQKSGATAEEIAEVQAKAEEKKQRVAMTTEGILTLAGAAREVFEAARAFASFNYVEGALHTVAAALGFAQGAALLAGNIPTGGGASVGAASSSGGGGVDGLPVGAGNREPPEFPTSPAEERSDREQRQGNSSNRAGSGGTSVTVINNGNMIGANPGELAEVLRKVDEDGLAQTGTI